MRIPVDNWKLSRSLAKRIAEGVWGKGADSGEYDTVLQNEAYFFQTPGHGGYVCGQGAFTKEEWERLSRATELTNHPIELGINLLIQETDGERFVISESHAYITRSSKVKYNPSLGPIDWIDVPVVIAEEDIEWAIVEGLTDVKTVWSIAMEAKDPKEYHGHIRRIFQTYYPQLWEEFCDFLQQREEATIRRYSG